MRAPAEYVHAVEQLGGALREAAEAFDQPGEPAADFMAAPAELLDELVALVKKLDEEGWLERDSILAEDVHSLNEYALFLCTAVLSATLSQVVEPDGD